MSAVLTARPRLGKSARPPVNTKGKLPNIFHSIGVLHDGPFIWGEGQRAEMCSESGNFHPATPRAPRPPEDGRLVHNATLDPADLQLYASSEKVPEL